MGSGLLTNSEVGMETSVGVKGIAVGFDNCGEGISGVGEGGNTMFCTKAHAIVKHKTNGMIYIFLLIVIG
jgi:hypothetical protein